MPATDTAALNAPGRALADGARRGARLRRVVRWGTGLLLVALAAGCGGDHPDPTPPEPVRPSGPLRRLEPGTTIVATASVSRVLAPNAFVITDADLPVAGQLVVSETPVTVLVRGLVTVTGRVEWFDTAAFQRYGLSDPQLYEPFSGVVIVADDVRRYLPASPPAS